MDRIESYLEMSLDSEILKLILDRIESYLEMSLDSEILKLILDRIESIYASEVTVFASPTS